MARTLRGRNKRNKFTANTYLLNGNLASSTQNDQFIDLFDDYIGSPRKDSPCTHVSGLNSITGSVRSSGSGTSFRRYEVINYVRADIAKQLFANLYASYRNSLIVPLGFQQDDNFELLNFVGELDETLLIFSKRFWKDLSYGSVNWGLLPLYSDLKSLYNTYDSIINKKIFRDLSRYDGRHFARVNEVSFSGVYSNSNYTFQGKCVLKGKMRLVNNQSDNLRALLIMLDELGVHPDLKTVWDLVPLSFVLDYFLPIGDLLESMHPRGWFNPELSFTGSFSISGVLFMDYPVASFETRLSSNRNLYKCYKREYTTLSLGSRRPPDISFECPNFRQLFNTAYLSLQSPKKFR